jgi:hypothetical protein
MYSKVMIMNWFADDAAPLTTLAGGPSCRSRWAGHPGNAQPGPQTLTLDHGEASGRLAAWPPAGLGGR